MLLYGNGRSRPTCGYGVLASNGIHVSCRRLQFSENSLFSLFVIFRSLDAMGGTIKSENETETYQQEQEDLKTVGVARHRLTVMFSATMPTEVEQIAQFLLGERAHKSLRIPHNYSLEALCSSLLGHVLSQILCIEFSVSM